MDIKGFIESNPIFEKLVGNDNNFSPSDKQVDELIKLYGGCSFSNGLFRIHSSETSQKWLEIIESSFDNYKGVFVPFGFDWAGKQFGKKIDGETIYLFDINFGEVFTLESTISDFFNIDLVDHKNETINSELFFVQKIHLKFNEIAGLKIPIRLGGTDSLDNFEIIDSEVDWEINDQLKNLL